MTVHTNSKKGKPENGKKKQETESTDLPPPRYGPMPRVSNHRVWTRGVVIVSVLVYVWYTSRDMRETALAKQKEVLNNRGQNLDCDRDFLDEIQHFRGCKPKLCGRYVTDKLVTNTEADALLKLAKRGIALGGSFGGASILDLHSGALSQGEKFVNLYSLKEAKTVISPADLAIYRLVKNKIRAAIAQNFEIQHDSLYLTHPTFFSMLTNKEARTKHDEYWHIHIDKETYESFHYTSLLYLSDSGVDFKGGRLVFVDASGKNAKNVTVEPRKGRVTMFTSGAENPHYVEQVTEGVRYAITVSFTCDKSKSINDPIIKS